MNGERHERIEVDFPVSFVGDARGGGTVRNLSSGGCKIDSDIPVRETQLLVLRLALPHEASPVVIDVAAVKWSSGRTCGVQFISMKQAERQRLDEYLATLSPS